MSPRFSLLALWASVALVLSSCGDCGACVPSLTLEVYTATPDVSVSADDPRVTCSSVSRVFWYCGADGLPQGDYDIVLSAPGHEDRTVSFTIGPPTGGGGLFSSCSPCPGQHRETFTLVASDDPPRPDGGAGDGG